MTSWLHTVVIAPLKHETKYTYDGNGDLATLTDPELNVTKYTYDADNEPIKVEEPDAAITETGYDGAGQVTSQTDGNKHTTIYVRNPVEEVTEVIDPLSRNATKGYDAAGNLTSLTDAVKRTTTYKYDQANRLVEVSYSDGTTPTVQYEYDADGNRTKMINGTGTSKYTYDQLDRLTESKDGHGNVSSYEYDLANQQTKLTYPNGKAVTRSFDNAARLKSVTDWLAHTTKFGYDADSNLTATAFPSTTGNEDGYAYNEADAMSEAKMAKGAETLASLVYVRNEDGGVTKATTTGLPGEAIPAFAYDSNSRLTKGAGIVYKYDAAENPTKIATTTYTYDNASELKTGTGLGYTYDEMGERTKTNLRADRRRAPDTIRRATWPRSAGPPKAKSLRSQTATATTATGFARLKQSERRPATWPGIRPRALRSSSMTAKTATSMGQTINRSSRSMGKVTFSTCTTISKARRECLQAPRGRFRRLPPTMRTETGLAPRARVRRHSGTTASLRAPTQGSSTSARGSTTQPRRSC
jgi:YD repeat-containing protein